MDKVVLLQAKHKGDLLAITTTLHKGWKKINICYDSLLCIPFSNPEEEPWELRAIGENLKGLMMIFKFSLDINDLGKIL